MWQQVYASEILLTPLLEKAFGPEMAKFRLMLQIKQMSWIVPIMSEQYA